MFGWRMQVNQSGTNDETAMWRRIESVSMDRFASLDPAKVQAPGTGRERIF